MTCARVSACAAAVALIAATSAVSAVSPTQYRQKASAICRTTTFKLKTVKPPTSTAEINRFLKQALPIFTAQYLALRRLSVPRSLRVLHGRALTAEKLQLDGIRAGIKNLDAGADPTATFNAMDKKLSPIGDAEDAAWRKLHIAACVSVG
jgi:hypothetical protein